MVRKVARTEMNSTGTRYDVPRAPSDTRISYRHTERGESVYALPMMQPSTEEERRQLRSKQTP